jgi:hypothetical protein
MKYLILTLSYIDEKYKATNRKLHKYNKELAKTT